MSTEINIFPDPRYFPGIDGIVYVGADLESKTLLQAYRLGIFPWPVEGYPLLWHCPDPRGVLDFDQLHIPRSLARILKRNPYTFTFNRAFSQVIESCAQQSRKGQTGTWILPSFIPSYTRFHRAGFAHSVECWNGDRLVGGLYGVYVSGVFSGESMFHSEPNTSKLCLIKLVERLKSLGLSWMDIQMVTPVTKHLGGRYIPRLEFLSRLEFLRKNNASDSIAL